MATPVILISLLLGALILLVALYALKLSLHFTYLRLKDEKKTGSNLDFFTRHFSHSGDSERWKKSWLIFPLLFPVEFDEGENEKNLEIKNRIKQMNIAIYLVLIGALLLAVYISKAFPEGTF